MNAEQHLATSLQFEGKMQTCLEPLFKQTQLNYFGYNRYYSSANWGGLYSNNNLVREALNHGCAPLMVSEDGFVLKDGLYYSVEMKDLLDPYVPSNEINKYLTRYPSPQFHSATVNGFYYLRSNPYYQESFYFSAQPDIDLKSYSQKMRSDLKDFISTFLYNMRKTIQILDQKKGRYRVVARKKLQKSEKKKFPKKLRVASSRGDVFLSRREAECLSFLSEGLTYFEIAEELGLSERTVESYLCTVKNKTSCYSKRDLIAVSKDLDFYLE